VYHTFLGTLGALGGGISYSFSTAIDAPLFPPFLENKNRNLKKFEVV
jgi:hypothetical protein